MLDDGRHRAGGIALDAAVTRGVRRRHGENGTGVVVIHVLGDKSLDGLGTNERSIAVENHRGALEAANGIAHHAHSVAGSQALRLLDKLDVGITVEDGLHLFCAIAHHNDDAVCPRLSGGVHWPPDKRMVKELVRHFGMTRLHARSLTGSKDDGCQGHIIPPLDIVTRSIYTLKQAYFIF